MPSKRVLLTSAEVTKTQSNGGVKILLRFRFTPLLVLREPLAVCVCLVFLCGGGVCVFRVRGGGECVRGCCVLVGGEFWTHGDVTGRDRFIFGGPASALRILSFRSGRWFWLFRFHRSFLGPSHTGFPNPSVGHHGLTLGEVRVLTVVSKFGNTNFWGRSNPGESKN